MKDKLNIKAIPAQKRARATVRLGVIKEFEKFIATATTTGMTKPEAIRQFAAYSCIATRTLRRWIAKYKAKGLVGLVDTRGGRPKKVQPNEKAPRTKKRKQSRRDPVTGTITGMPFPKKQKKTRPKSRVLCGVVF